MLFLPPLVDNVSEAYDMAVYINTLKKMINSMLEQNNMPQINYGIGIGLSKDLVIKVGKKGVINDLVFIGEAVVNASNLSSLAARNGIGSIAMDTSVYSNIQEKETEENKKFPTWFSKRFANDSKTYNTSKVDFYHGDVVKTKFNKWIVDGMKDE